MIMLGDLVVEDCEDVTLEADPDDDFERLPNEVIVKILSYIPNIELASNLSVVSKRFFQLAMDPSLWTEIELPKESLMEFEECCLLLERSLLLHSLTIRERSDSNELAIYALDNCWHLKTLELIYCSKANDQFLRTLHHGQKSLRVINLWGSGLEDHHLIAFANAFAKLTEINLFDCKGVDDEGLSALARNCHNIGVLNLMEVTRVGDLGIQALVEYQKLCLQSLMLDGETLTDESYRRLSACTNLASLGISFADGMGLDGLLSIARLINLKDLTIKRAKSLQGNDFVRAFSEGHIKNLENLDITECASLDDHGLIAIVKNCPKLLKLNVNWCWELTDLGLDQVTRKCQALQQLHLIGIVKLTSRPLERIPHYLKYLTLLDLQQCPHIDDAVMKDMVRSNPLLTVINYYGEHLTLAPS